MFHPDAPRGRVYEAFPDGRLSRDDLSARKLSAFLGQSTMVVYHHFDSVDGLLIRVDGLGWMALLQRLEAVVNRAARERPCRSRISISPSRGRKEVIEEYSLRRLSDIEFVKSVTEIMESVRDKKDSDTPSELLNSENAQAFYRNSKEILKSTITSDSLKQLPVELGLNIESIIKSHIVVDWKVKQDTINKMKQEIDDMIYDLQDKYDIQIETKQLNDLIDKSIEIAKNRYE